MQNFYNQITTNKPSTNPDIEKLASITTLSPKQMKAAVSNDVWNVWAE